MAVGDHMISRLKLHKRPDRRGLKPASTWRNPDGLVESGQAAWRYS
jgi:hypothetical protein